MKKKLIALAALLMLVAAPGALYFMGYISFGKLAEAATTVEVAEVDDHDEAAFSEDSLYLPLDPPFVVNFTHLGTLRYLQISLEIMYHDQELLDRVEERMPAIRNDLILLLSNQEYDKLNSLAGKEQIRDELMLAINNLILEDDEARDSGEIYFTNFVMQ